MSPWTSQQKTGSMIYWTYHVADITVWLSFKTVRVTCDFDVHTDVSHSASREQSIYGWGRVPLSNESYVQPVMLSAFNDLLKEHRIKKISAGYEHALFVTSKSLIDTCHMPHLYLTHLQRRNSWLCGVRARAGN